MIYKHLVLSTSMWKTAQYSKYATKADYLSYRIQLTLLRSDLALLICHLIRVRKQWLYVSVNMKRMLYLYSDINGTGNGKEKDI